MERRCCCRPCDTIADNFNNPDDTNIGSNWEECIGDWSILNNTLAVSSSGAIAIYHNNVAAWFYGRGVGQVDMVQIAANKTYRLICGYGSLIDECDDTWVSVIAEFEILGDGISAVLRLIISDGGSETIVAYDDGQSVSEGDTFWLCVGEGRIEAWTDASIIPIMDCVARLGTFATPTGLWWGLGTGTDSGLHQFDNFLVTEHYSTNPNDCPSCSCGCDGLCLGDTLTFTIEEHWNCQALDGLSGQLTHGGPSASCSWESAELNLESYCWQDMDPFGVQFWFHGLGPPGEYTDANDTDVWEAGADWIPQQTNAFNGPVQPGSSCDPLYLKFGPFTFGGDPMFDETCCEGSWELVWNPDDEVWEWDGLPGTFYIIITE